MNVYIRATREKGKTACDGKLAVTQLVREQSGTIAVCVEGESHKATPIGYYGHDTTKYSGVLTLDVEEIVQLFRYAVNASDQPDTFKRVCDTVVNHFIGKAR